MNVRNMTNDQLETLAEFAYNLAEERAAREKLARRVSELQADFVEVLCRLNRLLDADFDDVVAAVAAVEKSTNTPPDAASITAFEAWRLDADGDFACDTFDMALGWFAGRGLAHDHALALAARLTRRAGA